MSEGKAGKSHGGGSRNERLEAELRANLKRRKAQARVRSGRPGTTPGDESGGVPET
ncbi:MAG: hypothetical protein KDJ47_18565 [Hyphomicrobiaceae bacterium]|nr:hypothetical protein [Hyphomicrobiaceae bacterium]